MPRLGYKKSRQGCLKCKQRRIKCDEKAPCAACVKHGVECSLKKETTTPATSSNSNTASPAVGNSAEGSSSTPSSLRHHQIQNDGNQRDNMGATTATTMTPAQSAPAMEEHDTFSYFATFVATQQRRESTSQRMMDLVIMNHYTALTWKTLPKGPDRDGIWQMALPRLAGGYPFLMHQLLGLSARHMAFIMASSSSPSSSFTPFPPPPPTPTPEHNSSTSQPLNGSLYSLQASQHQEMAVQGLREVVLDIGDVNCHAIFAAATLLPICAFASHAEHMTAGGQGPSLDNLLQVFALLRGMNGILQQWETVLAVGPLGKLLQVGPDVSRGVAINNNNGRTGDGGGGGDGNGNGRNSDDDGGDGSDEWAQRSDQQLLQIMEDLRGCIISSTSSSPTTTTSDTSMDDGYSHQQENEPDQDHHEEQILRAEVDVFIRCIQFARAKAAVPELRVATLWPIYLSDDFLRLLNRRQTAAAAAAMDILVCYARIVCLTESDNWYMRGWGSNILKEIEAMREESRRSG